MSKLWDSVTLISIHTPLAGSDSVTFSALYCVDGFQSTLPLRGATLTHSA